ncbi:MAG: type II toxin-antitoxin system Phd/YefM family antitoxin [Methylococcales bacterium]|nr:type II toxin-antitoxin system Phd/YefM family antitoxin [Methylococcales bacterium]
MKYSSQIQPLNYLQTHTAEIAQQLIEQKEPFLITQNGKASFVLQDIESYEQTQQSIALLKILALGNQQIKRSEVITATQAIKKLRERNNDL